MSVFSSKCRCHGRRCCVSCAMFTFGYLAEHFLFERTPLVFLPRLLGLH